MTEKDLEVLIEKYYGEFYPLSDLKVKIIKSERASISLIYSVK